MNEVTILYYTSNREPEKFENKVREIILQNKDDLPIVSVSQKPIDFGKNICVGEHENSYFNEFRQIQIGLRVIETPFVLICEADTLYPLYYFKFVPPERGKIYGYNNVWIHWHKNNLREKLRFYFMGHSDAAQIVDRQVVLEMLDNKFLGKADWDGEIGIIKELGKTYRFNEKYSWGSEQEPIITLKTGFSVSPSGKARRGMIARDILNYWGDGCKVRKLFN